MAGYRTAFQTKRSAASYDDVVYGETAIANIWWQVESEQLVRMVEKYVPESKHRDYLDFACGTGRITSALASKVRTTTGMDVSRAMLDRARSKVPDATLICKDITKESERDPVEKYDLITAFRFLANAEQQLRIRALIGLRRRMRNEDSILIINNHGNPFSFRLLFLPYHWLNDLMNGRALFGYMTNRQVVNLLNTAGFSVVEVVGSGFVPGKAMGVLPVNLAARLESFLSNRKMLHRFGVNQMFVCRPTRDGHKP